MINGPVRNSLYLACDCFTLQVQIISIESISLRVCGTYRHKVTFKITWTYTIILQNQVLYPQAIVISSNFPMYSAKGILIKEVPNSKQFWVIHVQRIIYGIRRCWAKLMSFTFTRRNKNHPLVCFKLVTFSTETCRNDESHYVLG